MIVTIAHVKYRAIISDQTIYCMEMSGLEGV